MRKSASIYLDLMRVMSAFAVLLFHAQYERFDGAWIRGIPINGPDAVVVFFVLSGFVIAYVTNTKEKTLDVYTRNRLARLYSVAFPALMLTLVLDYFGRNIDPSMYAGPQYQSAEPVLRIFLSLFFLNEVWFQSWRVFSNGPFWSLSFEFWYYIIYASFFFSHGFWRWLFGGVALLLAGPKIALLYVVWLMGVFAFHVGIKCKPDKMSGLLLTIVPIAVYAIYVELDGSSYLLNWTAVTFGNEAVSFQRLGWSRLFLNDYVVGALVAFHLIGVISLSEYFSFSSLFEKIVRYFSGMTFALYLFHYPFLQFFGSFVKSGVVIVFLTVASIIVLSPVSEGKKGDWQRFFGAAICSIRKITRR